MTTSPPRSRWEWGIALGWVLLLAAAMALGRLHVSPPPGLIVPAGGFAAGADGTARLYLERAPGWYGSVQTSPHRGAYRVLSPQAGVLALLLLGFVFGRYAASPPVGKTALTSG